MGTSKFMRNPASVLSPDHMLVPAQVRHFYMVGDEYKVTRLLGLWGLISRAPGVIVFCNTRRVVDYLAENVMQAGLQARTLHADYLLRSGRCGRFGRSGVVV